jgi:hypothetical protein
MATITISGNDFTTYSNLAEADIYFLGSAQLGTWNGYTDAEKERGLITATRLIDRQSWQGEKSDDDQVLDFPRTGLSDCNGSDVTAAESLALAVEASQLLALDILAGATVETTGTNESLTKRLKADTVEIEYFRAEPTANSRFDKDVMELVGCFLSSNSVLSGSIAYGTDGTALDNDFSISKGI